MATDSYVQRAEIRQGKIQTFAFVISVCGCALLSISFSASSLVAVRQSSIIELDEKINPNNAPAASLLRLPGIGTSRAEAIVAYRDNVIKEDNDSRAFRNCEDLQKIKGIGPITAQNISGWLKFE
jgi:competence ComEA-like helix-hairpin-helix protein